MYVDFEDKMAKVDGHLDSAVIRRSNHLSLYTYCVHAHAVFDYLNFLCLDHDNHDYGALEVVCLIRILLVWTYLETYCLMSLGISLLSLLVLRGVFILMLGL